MLAGIFLDIYRKSQYTCFIKLYKNYKIIV